MVAIDYNNLPMAVNFLINQINELKEQLKESARFNVPKVSDKEEILIADDVARLYVFKINGTLSSKINCSISVINL